MRAEEMFKNYTKMKQEMTVLEFKIRDFEGIRKEDVIESMNFSKPQGDRVQEGMVSDKTGRAAAYYRRVADRLDDEYFDELFRRYLYLKDEIDFFGFLTTQLSGRLPEFVRDMVMEQMDWNGLMEKYSMDDGAAGWRACGGMPQGRGADARGGGTGDHLYRLSGINGNYGRRRIDMAMQKKSPGNAHEKRNCWQRGNGSYSMRGELRRGISLNKKYLNRKVRHSSKQALKHGEYRRVCKTLHMVEFS